MGFSQNACLPYFVIPSPSDTTFREGSTVTLIHTDSRSRVSLGKILQPNRDYRVSVGEYGVVTLEPVTTISDYERAVLANPELVVKLEEAVAGLERGEGVVLERRDRTPQSDH